MLDERTPEEKRQAVVFAARFRYSCQTFHVENTNEIYTGDPFDLPPHVEPLLDQRERWNIWRNATDPKHPDSYVDAYQFKHWSGGMGLACLHDAGLALDVFWLDGLGFCEPQHMRKVTVPEPGDIAWFLHNSHYAVVERVRGNLFDSIDGNQGRTLATPAIGLRTRELSSAHFFYSIDKFLTPGGSQ